MRLIDADELIEHAWRDKLDSRELIAEMIEKAPTIKEIPTTIPIDVFEKLVSQEPKTGRWIDDKCSVCGKGTEDLISSREWYKNEEPNFCPFCGARMMYLRS